MNNEKDIIREGLFIKDEDKKLNVKEIVETLKPFLRIDPENKEIIFLSSWNNLTNYEKLIILLTAKYLGKVAGVFSDETMNLKEISEKTGIEQTTLSAPLGRLVREKGILAIKTSEKPRIYKINEITIETFLNKIKDL